MSRCSPRFSRREILKLGGSAFVAAALPPVLSRAATAAVSTPHGTVVGDRVGAQAGERILAEGGNAFDAAVAAAFATGVVSPGNSGMGGYGGHAMIGLAGGRRIISVDFNGTAPAAARADMFPLGPDGSVRENLNLHGWRAAGVPGVAAGMEHIMTRYGTRSFREVLAPAIALCESGDHVAAWKGLAADRGNQSRPPPGREEERVRALGALYRTFAARDSTESFYRGDIADQIAGAFRQNGGILSKADLAGFRAREVNPLRIEWNGATLHTAPPTTSGLLLLEAIGILKQLDWPKLPPERRLHAKLEALRIAWADRTRTFGDPEHVKIPVEQLLSPNYAASMADKVRTALMSRRPVPLEVQPSRADGTTHLSVADRHGNMIAMTFTLGGGFGARVIVEELGLILGNGMSRFDPRPDLPNSPGPGKRPQHNMCPMIVTRNGVPVFAVGAAGGTRIPNSVYEVLLNHVGLGATLEAAVQAPRLNTDGTLAIGVERSQPEADTAFLGTLGYQTSRYYAANVSAVVFDPKSGQSRGLSGGGGRGATESP